MWWTTKEVACLLGCSPQTVEREVRRGALRARRAVTYRSWPGNPKGHALKQLRYLITTKALEDYLAALEEASDQERVAKLKRKGGVCPTCKQHLAAP